MNNNKTCIILGAGPKIGTAVAKRFLKAHYKIALGARGKNTLESVTEKTSGFIICKPV